METYYQPVRPLRPPSGAEVSLTIQQRQDELLDIDDVIGKPIISTQLHHTVTIREENATAALEVMSRFAASPKWLIYLSPTMSPSETSGKAGYLEHPEDAFAYYRHQGVGTVIVMETGKNLHASIPTALLVEAEKIAAAQHVSMDELTQAAMKRYLDELGWKKLYAYGEGQARELGIKEEDVDRIIHEFRDEERERLNTENGR